MSKGCIYVLTNPSFPEYVKIGYADNLEERVNILNRSSAVPYAFRVTAYYDVPERLSDHNLHDLIDKLDPDLRSIERIDGKIRKREFYKMKAEDAYTLLECIATISGTTDRLHRVQADKQQQSEAEEAEETRENARKGPLKFSECGIKVGEKVYFVKDKSKFAVVVDDRHVMVGNEITSLSALAKEWLGTTNAVQGPAYFTYNGKLLTELRK